MAKAKGKEKPAASTVPEEGKEKPAASTVPEEVEEVIGDDVPAETEPVKMEVEETTLDADKSEEGDKPEDVEQPDKEKELNENGTLEAVTNNDTPADDKAEEGDTKEETKGDESTEKASNKKGKRIRKRKRAAADAGGSTSTADKSVDLEKKGLMKPESKGLIFMCNAKTKKECFNNNIFGLPPSKQHLVSAIEKGMTLFLYDVDSKMMHGIYQAAGPGGHNIEPAIFGAQFPSQVRFSTVSKCKPLSQEQFKVAIKANYYGRNKFNTQLSQEQVDALCKLFESEDRSPAENKDGDAEKSPIASGRDRRGKAPNSSGRDRRGKAPNSSGRGRTGKAPNSAGRDRNTRPSGNFRRGAPYYPRGISYPARDSYAPRYPPVPLPAYPYGAPGEYYYRGEPREPVEYREPYSSYREPAAPYYPDAGYPSRGLYAPPPQYRY